jgi:hypothetical protein
MANIRKLYVDSRFCEGNGSNFSLELPETVNCSLDCVCYVTDVSFPIAWHTIDVHNDRIFLLEKTPDNPAPHARVVQIPRKDYTLGSDLVAQVKSALNTSGVAAAFKYVSGTYDVTFNQSTFSLTVTLAGGGTFTILSFDQLRDPYFFRTWRYYATQSVLPAVQAAMHGSYVYERANPKTANDVLRISTQEGNTPLQIGTTQIGGSIDLRPVHTIYLTSETFSGYDVIGPNGGLRSTLRKITVTEPSKGLQYHEHSGHGEDYISVGGMSMRTLKFALKDSFGNVVSLNGGHCAFSLLFCERP